MKILWAIARAIMAHRHPAPDVRSPRYVKNNLPETFAELQRKAREEWEPQYVLDAEERSIAEVVTARGDSAVSRDQ